MLSRRQALSLPFALWGCAESEKPRLRITASAEPAPSSTRPKADPLLAFREDKQHFRRKGRPQPGDWLHHFPEREQSFQAYRGSEPTRPTAQRSKIYVLPIGKVPEERHLSLVLEHLGLFFAQQVKTLPAIDLPRRGRRTSAMGVQYDGDEWLDHVLEPRLPKDALCLLGLTYSDLTTRTLNFVFGLASLEERVGAHSFHRLRRSTSGGGEVSERHYLTRSFDIIAHETGHMFSLPHCVEHECLMNGVNSLDELDRSTHALCNVCLMKLQWNLGFNVRHRYEQLRDFYRKNHMAQLASWYQSRIDFVGDAQPPPGWGR